MILYITSLMNKPGAFLQSVESRSRGLLAPQKLKNIYLVVLAQWPIGNADDTHENICHAELHQLLLN